MAHARPRLLLLLPTTTYQADAFVDAARALDVDLTVASERPSTFETRHPSDLLTVDLTDPAGAAEAIATFAARHPLSAVVGVDDDTAIVAAAASARLGLPTNPRSAMEAARDKSTQRARLHERGVRVPAFAVHDVREDPLRIARETTYPCVIKPIALSASRGVIRADDPAAFVAAHGRLLRILADSTVRGGRDRTESFLVETYVPGVEFAVEGLLTAGDLEVLAVFDKPDPLVGPFFEETIYVTPARVPDDRREAIVECAAGAARALGLERGPIHAEVRLNDHGAWLIELAARPIGGKCGRVLRFGSAGDISLERMILAHALGRWSAAPASEPTPSGVMMIPTPGPGVLEDVRGVEDARNVPGVEDVIITVHRGQELIPLPEGSRYLGFIFARAPTGDAVESALRVAHGRLRVRLAGPGEAG